MALTTRDIGFGIRDFLDSQEIHAIAPDDADEDTGDTASVEFIDCSDPDNLTISLDNGQRFTVRIIAA